MNEDESDIIHNVCQVPIHVNASASKQRMRNMMSPNTPYISTDILSKASSSKVQKAMSPKTKPTC